MDEYLAYSNTKKLKPESDVTVASFLRYAVEERPRKLGRATVCRNIPAAISDYFRFTPNINPANSPLVKQTLKVIQRSTPKPDKDRLPLTTGMLENMVKKIGVGSDEEVRNMFMIILMTVAMLRESEVVQLMTEHVQERDGVISVFIRKSKTDQASDGTTVYVAETGTLLCPVSWFRRYCMIRQGEAPFLFHQMGVKKDVSKQLSTRTPNFIVKKMLELIGVNPSQYGSHSCRKGGCTTAVESGVDLRLVARHGRWKSSAIMEYVKDSMDTKLSVTRAILGDE